MKLGALIHMYPPYHNAGAEHMLHAMLKEAIRQGHTAIVVVKGREVPKDFKPYVLDGVTVTTDMRKLNHIDALITHLDCTVEAEDICERRGIPCVQIMHNNARPAMARKCDLAIYNTQWLLEDAPMAVECKEIVVHPPVWDVDYRVDNSKGEDITLINLQKPKGVEMFYRLAQDMPHLKFLGVKGSYGVQEPAPNLPNLTIVENQKDIRKVYEQTKILLMPSSYESYGRCAVEAAISGIPCIAHRTKGLWEALGEAGNFPLPDSDSWKAAVNYVIDMYPIRRNAALSLGKSLTPQEDMDRCLKAIASVIR